ERHFDALRHVLQDLAVDTFQRWAHVFEAWQGPLGLVPVNAPLFLFPGVLARGKRLVVDPATLFKLAFKDAPLAVREIDAVFERFTHQTPFWFSMECWTTSSVTAP